MTQEQTTQKWIKSQLDNCTQFWLKNGKDNVNGGLYTCLDREGNIYSTDKSVWMQGRCAWTFSALCNQYGKNSEWINLAKSCLDFLEEHCINREAGNRMYFTVTKEGKPLRQRRYCFSEGFYCMANAEYGLLMQDEMHLQRARDAYELVWQLNQGLIVDPVNMGPKTITATRKTRGLADPMIFLNLSTVMAKCDSTNKELYMQRAEQCVNDIIQYHYKPELKCTLESVGLNGEFEPEYTQGRVVNPGHVIECSWFIMEYAKKTNNNSLFDTACLLFKDAIEMGWDKEYNGLLYFVDCLNKPTEAYEHDMKLWWPHNEILIASLMAYQHNKDEYYLNWFNKTLDYCKEVFADEEYGEWYGYLRRDGKPTMPSTKGSTFKGPFHLPRMLMMVDKMLNEINNI